MKRLYVISLAILWSSMVAAGQDCKLDDFASFADVQNAVRRLRTQHMYTGWDDKIWNRSGDIAAVAIVKTIPDDRMTSPDTAKEVLLILRAAWACPSRCIATSSKRQPNVTILLLEHLHAHTSGQMQSEVDETKNFVLEQTRTAQ